MNVYFFVRFEDILPFSLFAVDMGVRVKQGSSGWGIGGSFLLP